MPNVGIPYLRRSFGKLQFEGPYNAGWVAAVKMVIPHTDRGYEKQIWTFDLRWYGAIREITEHYFGTRIVDSTGGIAEPQMGYKERWTAYLATEKMHAEHENRRRQDEQSRRAPRVGTVSSTAYGVLHVTADAPPEVIRAAHRALSNLHHPDKGGNTEVMARINAAFDELKKKGRV